MNEWINVSDSLPDDEITVLVELDDGEVWTGYLDNGIWRYVSADLISAKVTGWQHLPENRNKPK